MQVQVHWHDLGVEEVDGVEENRSVRGLSTVGRYVADRSSASHGCSSIACQARCHGKRCMYLPPVSGVMLLVNLIADQDGDAPFGQAGHGGLYGRKADLRPV